VFHTVRAILIGVLLIPLNILWVTHVEYVRYSDNVSTSSLFFNAITLLLALTALNAVLTRILPRLAFRRGEMLIIYVMVVVSTAVCGHDQLEILFSGLSYVIERATPENEWGQIIHPYLPLHLLPPAGDAVTDLYRGNTTLYEPGHIIPWLRPLAWWASFAAALFWVMLCIAAIFRRQWEAERLTYPIAEMPLQITDPKTQVLASPLFWAAFALAAGVRTMVVAHLLAPSVPELPVNVRYYQLSPNLPWSAANPIPVSFFPFAIGLSFFLPAQISFSVWAFFVLTRLEKVAAAAAGFGITDDFPYVNEQGAGAALGLALAVLYFARGHLRRVYLHATGREKMDDSEEPLPYSVAFWGLIAGLAYILWFVVGAGLRPLTAAAFIGITFLFVIVTARIRAEVGLPTVELYTQGADRMLRNGFGDAFWTRREMAGMSLLFWMVRTHRQFPMSSQVDGMRIAGRGGISQRTMTAAMLIAGGVAIVTAFWAYLHVMYQIGYESARYSQIILSSFGAAPWDSMSGAINSPVPPNHGRVGGYAVGMGLTLILSILRVRFPGWPLHPVGLVSTTSWGVMRLWVPILLAWCVKSSLLRYGGLRAYQKAIPFFIGLICGEFAVGMAISLLNLYNIVPIPPEGGLGGL